MVKYLFWNDNSREIKPDEKDLMQINLDILSKFGLRIVPDKYCFVNNNGLVNNPVNGDIIEEINLQIEKKYDYHLVYTTIDINNISQSVTVLNEEVAYRFRSDEEKAEFIINFINKLVDLSEERRELIITDYYLFSGNSSEEYKKLLSEIFNKSNFAKIVVITSCKCKAYCEMVKKDIEKNLMSTCILEIKHSEEIHDRFWIANRKKAFVMGTSLNGFGRKFCYIKEMENEDTAEVMKFLADEHLV